MGFFPVGTLSKALLGKGCAALPQAPSGAKGALAPLDPPLESGRVPVGYDPSGPAATRFAQTSGGAERTGATGAGAAGRAARLPVGGRAPIGDDPSGPAATRFTQTSGGAERTGATGAGAAGRADRLPVGGRAPVGYDPSGPAATRFAQTSGGAERTGATGGGSAGRAARLPVGSRLSVSPRSLTYPGRLKTGRMARLQCARRPGRSGPAACLSEASCGGA